MAIFQSEERLRLKRIKSEQAIALATKNRWQEAVEVNREILEVFPRDVDALNRLGKALMELGRYAEAREAYGQAAKLDPSNTIAAKNLQRLSKLAAEAESAQAVPAPVDPRLFIEESGRTAVTSLVNLAAPEVIARLAAGDPLTLQVADSVVRVLTSGGEPVGQLEPKLGQRVLNLLKMGNRYVAAVTSVEEQVLKVILREVHRDPRMGTRPSFPATAPEPFRGYMKDVFRYGLGEEEEEEEEEPTEAEEEVGGPVDQAALDERSAEELEAEEA